jgi:ribosome biogenesis GTPase A
MIQWFPGHMAKTRKLITENIKLVDVVIEMVDARLPLSSRNPLIDDLIGAKPRLIVMAKADLAEEAMTKAWIAAFAAGGWSALACNFRTGQANNNKKVLLAAIQKQGAGVLERRRSRGIIDKTIRVMVTGIPNVGKSTLINLFAGRARAETGDKPGVTKGKQWIRLTENLELLDMPGILWPKIEDADVAHKLAATGAIGENAYDPAELSLWLINWLRAWRPGRLTARYGISEDVSINESTNESINESIKTGADPEPDSIQKQEAYAILEDIGRRRGFLRRGGVVEIDQAAVMVLDELRSGKLGPITWDDPADWTAGQGSEDSHGEE